MVSVSNVLVAIINTILLLVGLAAIGVGITLAVGGGQQTQCRDGLERPLMVMGAAIFFVATIGLVGSCCRNNFFLFVYLVVMFTIIVALLLATVFLIFVTNQSIARTITKMKIYNLDGWLRRNYANQENWVGIRSCLVDAQICRNVVAADEQSPVVDFVKKRLSSTQSGCCTPPPSCGFAMKNATIWIPPKNWTAGGTTDRDCSTWSNKQTELCYECESCKAAFVSSIKRQWRILAIVNVCVLIFAITVYVIGCYARFSNSSSSSSNR
ncbi:TET11, partial [Linum grandiflorum]